MSVKVLVADDDFDNRTIAQEALEAAGYHVNTASDGDEAMAAILSQRPAVVLLDMSMPKISGWEIARRVRDNKELSAVALIAFTAHALAGDELKARSAGCDDYLPKPCLPKDIVERVRKWAEKSMT
jgi:two-component system cell cycle response regulator DivK